MLNHSFIWHTFVNVRKQGIQQTRATLHYFNSNYLKPKQVSGENFPSCGPSSWWRWRQFPLFVSSRHHKHHLFLPRSTTSRLGYHSWRHGRLQTSAVSFPRSVYPTSPVMTLHQQPDKLANSRQKTQRQPSTKRVTWLSRSIVSGDQVVLNRLCRQ